jgi:hypothetical protein
LEAFLGEYPEATFLFTKGQPDPNLPDGEIEPCIRNLKSRYYSCIRNNVCLNNKFWQVSLEGAGHNIGTHSARKAAATDASHNGATPQEVEVRGCWKMQGNCIVHRYIDVRQLFTDAKVAGMLCKGGPVAYRLVEENISNEWLFEHVCPNIRARFMNDTRFCRIMGLAMLWACMDGEWKHNVDHAYQVGVETAYNELYSSLNPGADPPGNDGLPNPVYKAPLNIY